MPHSSAPRPAAAFLRVGGFLADTIFLAQILALCGFVFWFFGESDLAGFAIIGGSVAGLLSVFAFNLFGAASWFWGAAEFWRTFHPLNLALALSAAAIYAAVVYGKFAAVLLSATCGFAAALAGWRFLPHHPRAWIVICIVLLAMRYVVPWRFSGVLAAAAAVLVFSVWLRKNLSRRCAAAGDDKE